MQNNEIIDLTQKNEYFNDSSNEIKKNEPVDLNESTEENLKYKFNFTNCKKWINWNNWFNLNYFRTKNNGVIKQENNLNNILVNNNYTSGFFLQLIETIPIITSNTNLHLNNWLNLSYGSYNSGIMNLNNGIITIETSGYYLTQASITLSTISSNQNSYSLITLQLVKVNTDNIIILNTRSVLFFNSETVNLIAIPFFNIGDQLILNIIIDIINPDTSIQIQTGTVSNFSMRLIGI